MKMPSVNTIDEYAAWGVHLNFTLLQIKTLAFIVGAMCSFAPKKLTKKIRIIPKWFFTFVYCFSLQIWLFMLVYGALIYVLRFVIGGYHAATAPTTKTKKKIVGPLETELEPLNKDKQV